MTGKTWLIVTRPTLSKVGVRAMMFPVLPDQLLSVSGAREGDLLPVSLSEGVRGAREGVGGRRVEITETPVLALPPGLEDWGRVRHLLTVRQLDQNKKVGVLQN